MKVEEKKKYEIIENIGKYGIITAKLSDPHSQLVDKFLNFRNKEINAVGIYYYDENENEKQILLYNIYNSKPIEWLKWGSTVENCTSSCFIDKITFYPIKNGNKPENFRTCCFDILNSYEQNDLNSKNDMKCYLHLIKYNKIYSKNSGFNVIKNILKLYNKNKINFNFDSNEIYCDLLEKGIALKPFKKDKNIEQSEYIISQCKPQIIEIISIYIELWINDPDFRNKNILLGSKDDKNIIQVDDATTGSLINSNLNNYIKTDIDEDTDIDTDTDTDTDIDMITNTNIKTKTKTKTKTFDNILSEYPDMKKEIRKFCSFIKKLYKELTDDNFINIEISKFLNIYNSLSDWTNEPKIKVKDFKIQIQKNPMKTQQLAVGSKIIYLDGSNIQNFSEKELWNIIIYIESLRTTDGTKNDMRFETLQNSILKYISKKNIKKIRI